MARTSKRQREAKIARAKEYWEAKKPDFEIVEKMGMSKDGYFIWLLWNFSEEESRREKAWNTRAK